MSDTFEGGPEDGRPVNSAVLRHKAAWVCTRQAGEVTYHTYVRGEDGTYRYLGECAGYGDHDHPEIWCP